MLSPADPMVWTRLFSRMVEPPNFFSSEMDSTAMGIDADTVSLARSARVTTSRVSEPREERESRSPEAKGRYWAAGTVGGEWNRGHSGSATLSAGKPGPLPDAALDAAAVRSLARERNSRRRLCAL